MRPIDLMHLGRERVIGTWLIRDALIDPGPQSCMATLLQALEGRPPRVIALTHIHLDHAGATGSLLARFPEIEEVWVHERGARHMIRPREAALQAPAGSTEMTCSGSGGDAARTGGPGQGACRRRAAAGLPGRLLAGPRLPPRHIPARGERHGDLRGRGGGADLRAGPCSSSPLPRRRRTSTCPPGAPRSRSWRPWQVASAGADPLGRYEDVSTHISQMRESLAEMESWAREGDEERFAAALAQKISQRAAATLPAYARRCLRTNATPGSALSPACGCLSRFLLAPDALASLSLRPHAGDDEKPRVGGPGSGTGGPWRVIVRNDDHNTFEHVARTLARFIPGVSLEQGHQIASVIHNSGQAIVYTGEKEPAEHYWEQLKGAGLTMAPLEKA